MKELLYILQFEGVVDGSSILPGSTIKEIGMDDNLTSLGIGVVVVLVVFALVLL